MTLPFDGDHVGRANCAQRVHSQRRRGAVNAEDLTLAILRAATVAARRAVVIEEAVQTRAVDGDGPAVVDAQTQSIAVAGQASAEVGVV